MQFHQDELKYAVFSRTGCKTKKLRRSKLFLSMVFKHGLLEGSTILLQYSGHNPYTIGKLSIRQVKICNFSRIGRKTEEQDHSKFQKNHISRRAHKVTVWWTGSDRFGQVWTSQNSCEALFFLNRELHALQIWPTPKTCVQFSNRTSLEALRPSKVGETALLDTSIGIRCEKV